MKNLDAILAWKFGAVADTVDGQITAWRHPLLPQPNDQQLLEVKAEYELHLENEAKKKIKDLAELPAKKQALLDKLKINNDDLEVLKQIFK